MHKSKASIILFIYSFIKGIEATVWKNEFAKSENVY